MRVGSTGSRWTRGVAASGILGILAAALMVGACTKGGAESQNAKLIGVAAPDDWPNHGRDVGEDRFSPLTDISENNVDRLGLAWSLDIDPDRGMETTPIVVDGVMYVTTAFSIVLALDPETGKELWRYDPQVNRGITNRACCGPVNRGVAVANGMVFVGALDGKLNAVDAKTGALRWSADTFIDRGRNYSITGAPRIAGDKVLIGNGGAEFGVRGYVSAYDINTGKLAWRFFTVPGDPKAPDASTKAMQIARPTWYGSAYIAQGGGGTVWDSMVYDPELKLLYIGTGNGSFWSRSARSEGKGDNLFLSSIVAINPENGEYVWHYQTTPGDQWDYTATQQMILADLKIDGKVRKVIMQAPKNGFFYVIDRTNGQFISAKNFVPVNWATGFDKNGRPNIDTKAVSYEDGEMKWVQPANLGGHSWHPMSFNPQTGLVYIPATINAMYIQKSTPTRIRLGEPSVAVLTNYAPAVKPAPGTKLAWPDYSLKSEQQKVIDSWQGQLIAWDPIAQRAAWTQAYKQPTNGGVVSTAGNLVFQGTADGRFLAYRASDGKLVWQTQVNSGIVAPPITYRIKGVQYVAVAAGWAGAFQLSYGTIAQHTGLRTKARLLVFRLDGDKVMPGPAEPQPAPSVLPWKGDLAQTTAGATQFAIHCGICHGFDAISGGEVPDLRRLTPEKFEAFPQIVKGAFASQGMPDFSKDLTDAQIEEIRQYVARRNADLREKAGKD